MNHLPVISYQNSVNPPVFLGISAKYFDAAHYRVRAVEDFAKRGAHWVVYRGYCPIGEILQVQDGTYCVTSDAMYDAYYTHFGEAIAHLMVVTS